MFDEGKAFTAVSTPSLENIELTPTAKPSFYEKLNTRWHERALQIFMVIVLGHWAEHLVQAYQVWVLDRPRPAARGVLGQFFPWLVTSEWLHYWYAIVMLAGLFLLRPGFAGRART